MIEVERKYNNLSRTTEYFIKGTMILHREDGPAQEGYNEYKAWYINGKLSRLDGPAIEWADGSKTWYVNSKLHRVD
jgi:hypothetical protein